MLVGLGGALRDIVDGATLVIDADHGRLETAPSAAAIAEAQTKVEARLVRGAEQRAAAHADCYARDGVRVEVFANLGNVTEAAVAVDNGAEGCGLLRTEFLFIGRDTAPTEQEQFQCYQEITDALAGRPLILRLMDVGGDKPLQYLPLAHEDNPALGLRGVRTLLARPDLMRDQLRAALRVQPYGKLRLLIPMVTEAAEIVAVRETCDRLREELRIGDRIDIGAMIETPAAALIAASLLREVDFLSIGSNDLNPIHAGHGPGSSRSCCAQRRAASLGTEIDCRGRRRRECCGQTGRRVRRCGRRPCRRTRFAGVGVRELSVVPGAVPAIKQRIRALGILECRELALRCLEFRIGCRGACLDRRDLMNLRFGGLQQFGRALMLPIAVLPIAGLLLRLGQPDLFNWTAMAAAGDAVFTNLGLLFAVGVGVGWRGRITAPPGSPLWWVIW